MTPKIETGCGEHVTPPLVGCFKCSSSRYAERIAARLAKAPATTETFASVEDDAAHLWLCVTVCNQTDAEEKIPVLFETPVAMRVVIVKPMLGPVNLYPYDDFSDNGHGAAFLSPSINAAKWPGLDWVICGGETGPNARPMLPDWVRGLRDQCRLVGVPFFFAGWGRHIPPADAAYCLSRSELHCETKTCAECKLERAQNIRAGRLLDGVAYSEFPACRNATRADKMVAGHCWRDWARLPVKKMPLEGRKK